MTEDTNRSAFEEPDRWVELFCPVCGNSAFDGQGHVSHNGEMHYQHQCPDCGTVIAVPLEIDGERIGTCAPGSVPEGGVINDG